MRRIHLTRRACGSLALTSLALLAAAGPADAAEPRAIDGNWTLHPSRMMSSRGHVACGDELVVTRNWQGDVWTFDGRDWSSLSSLPGQREGKTYGDAIAVSPSGKEICTEASGRVACWAGSDWKLYELPDWQSPVNGLALLATGELLVTGRGRIGLRTGDAIGSYDAGTWRELQAVMASSLTDIWTVGQGGTVMRRTGSSWARMATGTTGWLQGIHVESAAAAWAWGDGAARGGAPVVVRWNGSTWSPAHDGLTGPVQGMAGPADRPWASTDKAIARFDGARWAEELAATAIGGSYQRLGGICATRQLVVVLNEGRESGVLVRKR